MTGTDQEPNRFLGVPRRGEYLHQGDEPQHVLGFALSGVGPRNSRWLDYLIHPVARFRRWRQHRKLGPYAPG